MLQLVKRTSLFEKELFAPKQKGRQKIQQTGEVKVPVKAVNRPTKQTVHMPTLKESNKK